MTSTTSRHWAQTVPGSTALPRVLAGDGRRDLPGHLARHGQLPDVSGSALLDAVEAAGLSGRGGAGFPTARKWRAVASGAGPAVVVGNAAEGEPASSKDHVLLTTNPHLVLDGVQVAARAVGATRVVLYAEPDAETWAVLGEALREREDDRVELIAARHAFIAGEESAVVDAVSGGPGLPRAKPPRVFERGVDGRPTLVQNVETLAHAALVAHYGPGWFRALGTDDEPGTMLLTLHGGRGRTVAEAEIGTPLVDLVDLAGAQAVLIGGYHGTWVPADAARSARLSRASLGAVGATPGAGVVVPLPRGSCGVVETARVLVYLAAQSAGQCGPCLNGLPRIALVAEALAEGRATPRDLADLRRWAGLVQRRGACAHPDGTVRLLTSALEVFEPEVQRHLAGRCSARDHRPILDGRS
ncbi:NADH-ubiquinone oxidoreductase-F iron-sulfur binding region domain-containing protein [Isoptericola sp. b441]|uniref:NADH-ubiquinone oxidoreductase-F iron-sulfur binding region domain-containing protein n=1 Tax=Actinotalea lenta TaxID=3064654 RepID=A0ABT9DCN1_9CELL|nr:NADH-ubiquinone oxidoreductase-F iron-sulfur binding region domain-containing protein [Isoptericola sp. b441]MDO8106963.1 NADH-ubiquinone oxidoreductase-F iron-sulfur binding region domain-containing protein [Isoptericola sp. b441]